MARTRSTRRIAPDMSRERRLFLEAAARRRRGEPSPEPDSQDEDEADVDEVEPDEDEAESESEPEDRDPELSLEPDLMLEGEQEAESAGEAPSERGPAESTGEALGLRGLPNQLVKLLGKRPLQKHQQAPREPGGVMVSLPARRPLLKRLPARQLPRNSVGREGARPALEAAGACGSARPRRSRSDPPTPQT